MDDQVKHYSRLPRWNILRWMTKMNISSDHPGGIFSRDNLGEIFPNDDEDDPSQMDTKVAHHLCFVRWNLPER